MNNLSQVYVLLGGNIEPREDNISKAIIELGRLGIVKYKSSIYESEAWGFKSENNFLNMVLLMETKLEAGLFLKGALEIELEMGRERSTTGEYSSRTIDIDMLYFNSEIIKSKNLIIPHPRLHLRRFTLLPLAEIAPDFVHPGLGSTNKELLHKCTDETVVFEFGSKS